MLELNGEINKKELLRAHLGIAKGDKGDPGEDGYTPVKGVDYFTPEDMEDVKKTAEAAAREALDEKADVTYVNDRDQAVIDELTVLIQEKASLTDVDAAISDLHDTIDEEKADKSVIEALRVAIEGKADVAYVDEQDLIINDRIDTVEAIAKGKTSAYVFDTARDMTIWLAIHGPDLPIGTNLYIRETDVPDYWWDGSKPLPLETKKIDLSSYATKAYADERYASLDKNKQDKLIAGSNIKITGNVISSTGGGEGDVTKEYLKDNYYDKTEIDTAHYNKTTIDTKFYSKSEIDAGYYNKATTDSKLATKQNKLTPGDNITIDENNVISTTSEGDVTKEYLEDNYYDKSYLSPFNGIVSKGPYSEYDLVERAERDEFVKEALVNNTLVLTDEEQLKIEAWLGLSENYLTYYNQRPYQVNDNYTPAHKKYVDDAIAASGGGGSSNVVMEYNSDEGVDLTVDGFKENLALVHNVAQAEGRMNVKLGILRDRVDDIEELVNIDETTLNNILEEVYG